MNGPDTRDGQLAGPILVAGLGLTGRAVVDALVARGRRDLVLLDDRPGREAVELAESLGLDLVVAPDAGAVSEIVGSCGLVLPTPGLADHHPVMVEARQQGIPIASELDLAAGWDSRRVVAVTGTDGKTTVTTLVALMLDASGVVAALAGNNDTPLVTAIADPEPEIFVVEASSFRLGHSHRFAPSVATWLNFAPDHLDVHADLPAYEEAKASMFDRQGPDDVAILNADDPVVSRHRSRGAARTVTFSADTGDFRVTDGVLVADTGESIIAVDRLARRAPHDLANALAAAATALAAGATIESVATVLATFDGLPHRTQVVARHDGVTWVNDSKATVPHAVIAAVGGHDHVVLIAGGRNKGLDLDVLGEVVPRLRAAVLVGEAASDLQAVFEPRGVTCATAGSMDEAVALAAGLARPGDTVLLSPACTSHDWYPSYAHRGDDFARAVRAVTGGTTTP